MLRYIDDFLNKITMYRLVLYSLAFLWAIALVFSFFGFLPYQPGSLLLSLAFITAVSWITNTVFARIYGAPTNIESVYITALILVLIITPFQPGNGFGYLWLLAFISVWAMASKFIMTIKKKHIFNPAALAVAVAALFANHPASWWIGNAYMAPFVAFIGFLIVRKIRRFDLTVSFLIAAFITVVSNGILKGTDLFTIIQKTTLTSSLLFFAGVMLTEPLTTPPTRILRIIYGALVGFLFAPSTHIGSFYFTPEAALIAGNVFSYLVSPKEKLILKLEKKVLCAPDVCDFVFATDQKFNFKPGQYLEWTLGHPSPDSRGNRRYFTIASSPTESDIRMGVKFYPDPSTYKTSLLAMPVGQTIVASQLAGDFVLPKDKERKMVFIAGGIGITPFRSMIKYLLDKNEPRPITLFYSNKSPQEVVYKEIFDEAEKKLGIKTIYTLTKADDIPEGWHTHLGRLNARMIREEVPDYQERTFYLSGPHNMVAAFQDVLMDMGIPRFHIKTDFFPGFA